VFLSGDLHVQSNILHTIEIISVGPVHVYWSARAARSEWNAADPTTQWDAGRAET
jgi:hypothetical protein